MVKFAVCDDEREAAEHISDKLREYYPEECEIKIYGDGKSLLADSGSENFDAFFLDIVMPEMDGMELARNIREDNPYVKIVFVTNQAELAHRGYIYGAFRYVRKSNLEYELRETANSLKEYFDLRGEFINFKTPSGEVTRRIREIKYFEVKGHNITMVCDGYEDKVYGTIRDYHNRLKSRGFIQVHKSYLVNFRYIDSIVKNDVKLSCGRLLPLSRKRIHEVKKTLQEFSRNAELIP
ncbi:MAG: LytTR family DNA-binding domain-containing protein [Oscillospiraceae bacterium]|nr:LytTR family DNA-binding domain-containing protein [Oscillospiraceae bacterium]